MTGEQCITHVVDAAEYVRPFELTSYTCSLVYLTACQYIEGIGTTVPYRSRGPGVCRLLTVLCTHSWTAVSGVRSSSSWFAAHTRTKEPPDRTGRGLTLKDRTEVPPTNCSGVPCLNIFKCVVFYHLLYSTSMLMISLHSCRPLKLAATWPISMLEL